MDTLKTCIIAGCAGYFLASYLCGLAHNSPEEEHPHVPLEVIKAR
jgi:hypothetical protein